jgi:hypothetical protein
VGGDLHVKDKIVHVKEDKKIDEKDSVTGAANPVDLTPNPTKGCDYTVACMKFKLSLCLPG